MSAVKQVGKASPGKPTADEWAEAGKHQGLCVRTAWQVGRRTAWRRRGFDLEDLQQEGRMMTLRALRGFDASLGYAFSSYLSRVLWNGYLRLWHSRAKVENPSGDAEVLEREDTEAPAEEKVVWAERRDLVRVVSRKLLSREHVVLRMRYGGGHVVPLERIGRELGVCRERARQIERDAILRIREAIHGVEEGHARLRSIGAERGLRNA